MNVSPLSGALSLPAEPIGLAPSMSEGGMPAPVFASLLAGALMPAPVLAFMAPAIAVDPAAVEDVPSDDAADARGDAAESMGAVEDDETERALASLGAAAAGLDPELRVRIARVVTRMKEEFGREVSVVEGVRSQQRQNQLYAQGRTTDGPVVTWTRASQHTVGRAADLAINGGYADREGFMLLQQVARQEGLGVLGPRDPGHVELRGGSSSRPAAVRGDGGSVLPDTSRVDAALDAMLARAGSAPTAGAAASAAHTLAGMTPVQRSAAPAPQIIAAVSPVARVANGRATTAASIAMPQAAVPPTAPVPPLPPAASAPQPARAVGMAQVATVAAVAQVAGVARVASVASVARPGASAPAAAARTASARTPAGATSDAVTTVAASPAATTSTVAATSSVAATSPVALRVASADDAERRDGAARDAAAELSLSASRRIGAEQYEALSPRPTPPATSSTAQPGTLGTAANVAAPSTAALRADRAMAAQDAPGPRSLSSLVLAIDDGQGGEDRVRIGMRGASVGAAFEMTDRGDAQRVSARLGELARSLEQQGLEAESFQVRATAPASARGADAEALRTSGSGSVSGTSAAAGVVSVRDASDAAPMRHEARQGTGDDARGRTASQDEQQERTRRQQAEQHEQARRRSTTFTLAGEE